MKWDINMLILAAAIALTSVPAWYGAIPDYRHRDVGKQADAECRSLVATLTGDDNPYAIYQGESEVAYRQCLLARIRGGTK